MSGFEVLECGNATQVEGVLAHAAIAGTWSLAAGNVRESVLDGYSFAQSLAATRRRDEMPKALLKRFVGSDANLTPAIVRLRTLRSLWTHSAGRTVEADRRAERETLGLTLRASDGAVADVDVEIDLGKEATVRELPRTANHLSVIRDDLFYDGARDVSAVDEQLANLDVLVLEVILQRRHRCHLGHVGWRDRDRDEQAGVEIGGDVALVAIERVAAALAAMADLGVLDRNAAIVSNAVPDARSIRGLLEVLIANLVQRRQVRSDFCLRVLGHVTLDPPLEPVELVDEHAERASLLLGVEPVDIERGLDAGH